MSEESTLPENVSNPEDDGGYMIFAQLYVDWLQKRPVRGLRDLLMTKYPEETQLERDMLAFNFLQFEIMRWMLSQEGDNNKPEGKEPWQT